MWTVNDALVDPFCLFFVMVHPLSFYCIKKVWIDQNKKDMDRPRRHWQSTLYKFYQNFVWLNVIGHIVFKTHHYGIGWLVIQCDVPAEQIPLFSRQFVAEGQRLMKCAVGHMTEFIRKTSWFYRLYNLKSTHSYLHIPN